MRDESSIIQKVENWCVDEQTEDYMDRNGNIRHEGESHAETTCDSSIKHERMTKMGEIQE